MDGDGDKVGGTGSEPSKVDETKTAASEDPQTDGDGDRDCFRDEEKYTPLALAIKRQIRDNFVDVKGAAEPAFAVFTELKEQKRDDGICLDVDKNFIGESGSGPSGSGTGTEGIRKRRSTSKKRNYRQAASSSTDDDEPKSTSSKLDDESSKEKSPTVDPVKEEGDEEGLKATTSSNVLGNKSSNRDEEGEVLSSSIDHSPAHHGDIDSHDHASTSSDMPISPSSNDSDFFEHGEPRLAFYPGGVEIEDSDNISSDSTSSQLEFLDEDDLEEEEDSSESSDSLDDLEDRPRNRDSANADRTAGKNDSSLQNKKKKKKDQTLPAVLQKPKPKSSWCGPREIFNRELGSRRCGVQAQSAEIFRSKFYGSLFSAERLELMKKLGGDGEGHSGCVNCLNFNYSGTKLASGSDDMQIKIWGRQGDYGKVLTSFHSKHRSNVFQAKFMPFVGMDNIIISCARDRQVRLTELDSTGSVRESRKLASHGGPVHKLSINPETPHVALSCGEDGSVISCDIRENKAHRILTVKDNSNKKVALYSIHIHPLLPHEFCVSGRDEYIRIYDTRKLSHASSPSAGDTSQSSSDDTPAADPVKPVKRYCPHHLQEHRSKPHITAAVYNYNGTEIIGSYNDENIYLFDASHSDLADYVKCYEGHLNSATVKGVNFFGDRSQFVVSGSDCGHVFIWDKQTESIVNFFRGDENGVVNCLEPHPSAPILATSGLDDDVKIWIPSSETSPRLGDLTATVKKNIKKRVEEMENRPNALDGNIMMQLIRHLNYQRRRRRGSGMDEADVESTSSEDSDDDNGSRVECVIA